MSNSGNDSGRTPVTTIPDWAYPKPDARFGQSLQQKVIVLGFSWVIVSALTALTAYGYFFLMTPGEKAYASGAALWMPLALILLSLSVCYSGYRKSVLIGFRGGVSALLLSCYWLMLAWFVISIWGLSESAKTILLLGMLSFVCGFFAAIPVLLVAILPVLSGWIFLVMTHSGHLILDQLLSVVLLPLFLISVVWSMNRLFQMAQDKNDQNVSYARKITIINHTDELTGLANQKGFDQAMQLAVSQAIRFHTPLSLVVTCVDDLGAYNDALGLKAGNQCLKHIANLLPAQAKRSVDFVARTEGNRFAMILPGCDQNQAAMLAEKVQKALKAEALPHPAFDQRRLSLSYGIVQLQNDSPDSMYNKGCQALQQAKKRGYNQVAVFTSLM